MNQDNVARLDIVDLLMNFRTQQDTIAKANVGRANLSQIQEWLTVSDRHVIDALVEETDGIRLGHHAFDLARDLLSAGEVSRAKHWLSVAAEFDVADAASLLDDHAAINNDLVSGNDTDLLTDGDVPVDEDVIIHALIRAKENAELAQRDSEARFEEIFSTSSVGMAISDLDFQLIRSNRALGEILEYRRGRLDVERLDELFHPDDAGYLRLRYQVLLEEDALPFRERRRLVRSDGEEALVFLSASVLRAPDGTPRYYVTSAEDVSDKHFLEGQLQFQATHDALTGLVNRQRFIALLEEALGRRHPGDELAVFHLNLDGFRAVNNAFGRNVGDRLLQTVAARLREVFAGEVCTLARFDGDEFGVLLENSSTTERVVGLATLINDELSEPIYIGGEGIAVTATVAVAHRPPPGTSPADLLRATDTTLHRLKASGRRQWGIVDAQKNELDRARFTLASSLPGAWENGNISLDYEPLVTVTNSSVVAVQALLLWDHDEQGRLSHDQCLDVLAETGLSLPIGRWMLSQACTQLRSWIDQDKVDVPKLYVELTKELADDPDLVSALRMVLSDGSLSPKQVLLGMPVQAFFTVDSLAEDNLDVLVELGFDVVLYEFGSTRGDLACLEDLPVHAVKMSSRVVDRVDQIGDEALFTRAIRQLVPLVRQSGTRVLVGDIKTQEQFRWWRKVGADTVQGTFTRTISTQQDTNHLIA